MNSLPFCQYAIDVRLSRHWWLVFGVTKVSSSTRSAFLKPASRSPYDQLGSVSFPIGRRPALYSSTSACVHFKSMTSGMGAGCPGGAVGRIQTFPSTRGFGAPGNSDATGSVLWGNRSHLIL